MLTDLRFALRWLQKNRLTSAVAVSSIGVAIGANTAIFAIVYGLLMVPPPVRDPERLVVLYESHKTALRGYVSYPNFLAWREEGGQFDDMAAVEERGFDLVDKGIAERVVGALVTRNFFDVLGVQAQVGRVFSEHDDPTLADGPVCVVSHDLWRRWGLDPEILGKRLKLGRLSVTVIGVMPERFERWRGTSELWVPFEGLPFLKSPTELASRGYLTFHVIGRLKPGIAVEDARRSMDLLAERIAAAFPEADNGVLVVPLKKDVVDPIVARRVLSLLAGTGLVLLIACANVSNLLLAQATARQREMAIRRACGASRRRILRQCFTEGVVLAFAASAVGAVVAVTGTSALAVLRPPWLGSHAVGASLPVWIFNFGVAGLAGLATSLAPAARMRGGEGTNLSNQLKASGPYSPFSDRQSSNAARGFLVATQIALAAVLLAATGLTVRSFLRLSRVELVERPETLLTMLVSLPVERYSLRAPEKSIAFCRELLERTTALPGVEDVNLAMGIPVPSAGHTVSIFIEGGKRFLNGVADDRPMTPGKHRVTPGHFRMLGIRLLRGRDFTEADGLTAARVAIVNETMARLHWPGQDVVGRRVGFRSGGPWIDIVGVFADARYGNPRNPVKPEIYVPLFQEPFAGFHIVVRSRVEPGTLVGSLVSEIHRLDPLVPIGDVQTMRERIASSTSDSRYSAILFSLAAGLALLLAAAGIYSLMGYVISERTHEFGVRMALGARPRDLWSLVLKKAVVLLVMGLGAGVPGALALTRIVESLLYEVKANDPTTIAGVCAVLASVVVAASLAPARRAARLDPIAALRAE